MWIFKDGQLQRWEYHILTGRHISRSNAVTFRMWVSGLSRVLLLYAWNPGMAVQMMQVLQEIFPKRKASESWMAAKALRLLMR